MKPYGHITRAKERGVTPTDALGALVEFLRRHEVTDLEIGSGEIRLWAVAGLLRDVGEWRAEWSRTT